MPFRENAHLDNYFASLTMFGSFAKIITLVLILKNNFDNNEKLVDYVKLLSCPLMFIFYRLS